MNPEEMIRMLIDENARLRQQLQGGGYESEFIAKLDRQPKKVGPNAETTPYFQKQSKRTGPLIEKGPYRPQPGSGPNYQLLQKKSRPVGIDGY